MGAALTRTDLHVYTQLKLDIEDMLWFVLICIHRLIRSGEIQIAIEEMDKYDYKKKRYILTMNKFLVLGNSQ